MSVSSLRTPLPWKDEKIPHVVNVDENGTLHLLVRKDGGELPIEIKLPLSPQEVKEAWWGEFVKMNPEFNATGLFTQVRRLLQTGKGCVLWYVGHYTGPLGKTIPADSLHWLPGMKLDANNLPVPLH